MNISKTLIDKILIITSLIAALDSNSIHIMIRIRKKFTNSKDSTDLNVITPKNLNKNLLNYYWNESRSYHNLYFEKVMIEALSYIINTRQD